MGRIEDLYREDIAKREIEKIRQNLEEYNKNIDIINEIIREILNVTEDKRPIDCLWVTIKNHLSKKEEPHIAWRVACCYGESDHWDIVLISDGRLLYLDNGLVYGVTKSEKDRFINPSHINNPKDQELYILDICKGLVVLANSAFGVTRDNWPEQKQFGFKNTQEEIIKLLSEIFEELKQLNSKVSQIDDHKNQRLGN